MAVTILEALQNANHNLSSLMGSHPAIKDMAMEQLNNATVLLEKGYEAGELVEPLLEKYGDVDDVPDVDN